MRDEATERSRVVQEALSWLGTPYHLNGRVMGAGADCATLLVAAFEGAGLLNDVHLADYHAGFHLHRGDEIYLEGIQQYCIETVKDRPQPGDIIMYRYGRIVSHAALVVNWPQIIHAQAGVGVVLASGMDAGLRERQAAIFDFWGAK